MGTVITDFLVMGQVPGTDYTINFNAFIEGVLVGLCVLLTVRAYRKKKFIKTHQAR